LLEIVEAGQYNLNIPPELAPALKTSYASLFDYWGRDIKHLAFYVRKKNE
jgi:hypothetical protein